MFINSLFIKNQIKEQLSKFLLEKYAIKVTISDLSFFSLTGEMAIKGIKVKFINFEPQSKENDLEIKKISISLNFFSSIFKQITIKEINIESPRIRLIVDKGAIKNIKLPKQENEESKFKNMQVSLAKKGKTLFPKKNNFVKFDIRKLNLENLHLHGTLNKDLFELESSVNLSLKELFPKDLNIFFKNLKEEGFYYQIK